MSDGISRASGAGLWLKDREGKDYYLSGAIGAEGELEAYMLSKRKNPVDAVLPDFQRLMTMTDEKGTPNLAAQKLADSLVDRAFNRLTQNANERRVSPEDQIKFLQTREGFGWWIWRQLGWGAQEKGLPPPTQEKALEIVDFYREQGLSINEPDQLEQMSQQVSGTDLLAGQTGLSDASRSDGGPAARKSDPIPTATPRTANGAQSPGAVSIDEWRASMASTPAKQTA